MKPRIYVLKTQLIPILMVYYMDLDMHEIKLLLKNTMSNYHQGGEPLA